jgi:hypothetical protein
MTTKFLHDCGSRTSLRVTLRGCRVWDPRDDDQDAHDDDQDPHDDESHNKNGGDSGNGPASKSGKRRVRGHRRWRSTSRPRRTTWSTS